MSAELDAAIVRASQRICAVARELALDVPGVMVSAPVGDSSGRSSRYHGGNVRGPKVVLVDGPTPVLSDVAPVYLPGMFAALEQALRKEAAHRQGRSAEEQAAIEALNAFAKGSP